MTTRSFAGGFLLISNKAALPELNVRSPPKVSVPKPLTPGASLPLTTVFPPMTPMPASVPLITVVVPPDMAMNRLPLASTARRLGMSSPFSGES